MIDYDPLYQNGILPYKLNHFIESENMPVSAAEQQVVIQQPRADEYVPAQNKKIAGWKKLLALGVGAGLTIALFRKKIPSRIKIICTEKYSKYLKPLVDWTLNKTGTIYNGIKKYFTKK